MCVRSAVVLAAALVGLPGGQRAVAATCPEELPKWGQLRGPAGRGVAEDGFEYPVSFAGAENQIWKCPVSLGHSSPCIAADRLFLTGAHGETLEVMCIDRTDGSLLWRHAIASGPAERLHRLNSSATPTPTTDGERVYVYFGSLGLRCYDLQGREVWRRDVNTPQNTFGTAASPILADGKLIFLQDSSKDSYLEAIEPATGETLWRRQREGFQSGWSTPAVWQRGEVQELLIYGAWWLTAYDLADGSERWSVPGLTDEPIVMPATAGGLVFVTSYNMNTNPEVVGLPQFAEILKECDQNGDGQLNQEEAEINQSILSRNDADGEGDHPLRIFFRFLDEDEDGQIVAQEWDKIFRWLGEIKHANALLALRPPSEQGEAEIVWQHSHGVPECPSPLVYRDRIYLVKNGGIASCFDATTGELLYRERIEGRGPYYASPLAADGKIYCCSARGVITVLAAGDDFVSLASNDLGERILATPALVEGKLYIRGEQHLFALQAASQGP